MTRKVQWDVLGAANIAVKKVIPVMPHSTRCEVTALASRIYKRLSDSRSNWASFVIRAGARSQETVGWIFKFATAA